MSNHNQQMLFDEPTISEINITPVKPQGGLVGFASFVLFEAFYCGSVALFSRPDGSYRLSYPSKRVGERELDVFYPINRQNRTWLPALSGHFASGWMSKQRQAVPLVTTSTSAVNHRAFFCVEHKQKRYRTIMDHLKAREINSLKYSIN